MRNLNTRAQFTLSLRNLAYLGLLAVAGAAQAQTLGVNFTGVGGSQFAPPDTNGAVGPGHIVEFTNGNYAVYNKTGGAVASPVSDTSFWNNAGISSSITNAGLSDTRIVYDSSSQRWFASEITTASTGNKVLIARSNSSDPTAGWKAASFTAASSTTFGDYDTLSVNASGVYLSTNNFNAAGTAGTGTTLTSIPKSDLLLSTPSIANLSTFTSASNIIYQAAFDPSAATTGYVYGVTGNNTLSLSKITGAGAAGATRNTINLAVQAQNSPQNYAYQPDGTQQIDNGDNRIGSTVAQSGKFSIITRTVDDGTANHRSAIRYTVVNTATNTVASEGTIKDTSGNNDYSYPSISVNASGQVVVSYNRSGKTTFIGAYAQAGALDANGLLTLSGSEITLKAGTQNYHLFGGTGERWGDYASLVNDPSDPNSFWSFQEVALSANSWTTQITQIKTASTPAPGSLFVFAGALLPGLIALRRKRRK